MNEWKISPYMKSEAEYIKAFLAPRNQTLGEIIRGEPSSLYGECETDADRAERTEKEAVAAKERATKAAEAATKAAEAAKERAERQAAQVVKQKAYDDAARVYRDVNSARETAALAVANNPDTEAREAIVDAISRCDSLLGQLIDGRVELSGYGVAFDVNYPKLEDAREAMYAASQALYEHKPTVSAPTSPLEAKLDELGDTLAAQLRTVIETHRASLTALLKS